MQIILSGRFVILPRTAREVGPPVVGRAAVDPIPPDVVVPVGVRSAFAAFLKPAVLVRGVVDHKVDDHPHAQCMRLCQQGVKVRQRAELWVDGLIIADVIAHIQPRRLIEGGKPDHVHTQCVQIVQPGSDAGQVPDAIAVGVLKAAGVYLIHHRFLPPRFFHLQNLLFQQKRAQSLCGCPCCKTAPHPERLPGENCAPA